MIERIRIKSLMARVGVYKHKFFDESKCYPITFAIFYFFGPAHS